MLVRTREMEEVRFEDRVVLVTRWKWVWQVVRIRNGEKGSKIIVNDLGGSAFGDGSDNRQI